MKGGYDFEELVAVLLEFEIREGKLGLDPKCTRIFHRKSYPSRDRGRNIVFDVAIEVSRPGAPQPYLVWVWECKDYSRKVPVDDVEEFHAKLEQVGVHKTKGTMISVTEFQVSARAYAKAKGISLAVLEKPELRILRATEAIDPLATQPTSGRGPRFVGYPVQGRQLRNVYQFIQEELACVNQEEGEV